MKKNRIDFQLLLAVAAILVFGILALASISANFSLQIFGNTTYYLFHQLILGIVPGIILGFIAYKIKIDFYKKYCLIFLIMSMAAMFLVFIPGIGINAGGASRWLNFKFFTVQPSEILKIAFIIYLSSWLSKKQENSKAKSKNKDWRDMFLPFIAVSGVIALALILQKDLGTLLIILSAAGITYFSASTPLWQNFLLFAGGISLVYFLINITGYRSDRIKVWLDFISNSLGFNQDPMGLGFQMKQAIIAVGSGGIFGLGVGLSSQLIPQPMSDSIFAMIAEEMGFFGCLFLILAFLFFLWRVIKIAKNSKDNFSKLFCVGAGSWICIQAFVNMGAITGLLPLTGIPLPFISYGGTHILSEMVAVGILLNISKQNKK